MPRPSSSRHRGSEVVAVCAPGACDRILRAGDRREGGALGRRVDAAHERLLHAEHRLSPPGRRDEPSDARAGHRVRLRGREDREHPPVLVERRRAHVRLAPREALVDLVADDPQVVAAGEVHQCGERLAIERGAQRIRRRVDDEPACER